MSNGSRGHAKDASHGSCYSMIVEGIVSARVMKYGRRNSEEEEEELHVAKRGKKKEIVLLVLR